MTSIKNTLILLRFPFSLFLLPVSLFAFFYIHRAFDYHAWLVLGIWHLLVFPASNGYNSYQDRDEGPIGGLAAPPAPTDLLLRVVNAMDLSALVLSVFVNVYFPIVVGLYIVASRLYSSRAVRLKQFPLLGFATVFIFQGAWVFYGDVAALSPPWLLVQKEVLWSALACSFFIGTIYPLTQIYQHAADRADGVQSLSLVLGIKGTFVFSALLFMMATLCIYGAFSHSLQRFWLFNAIMLPASAYFLIWAFRSFRDAAHVNFRSAMGMLVLSALLNNTFFLILLFN